MNRDGFTLIELLLSVAAIAIIAGTSIPLYQTWQVQNDLDVATNTWVQTLRRAELLAQAVDGDTTWGVKAQSPNLTLFKGASYATRLTAFDELFTLPASITPSGVTEIVFFKVHRVPTNHRGDDVDRLNHGHQNDYDQWQRNTYLLGRGLAWWKRS